MRPSKQTGFSLVELLVVIGIIALLIGIAFPVVGKMRKAAYAASSAQSITALQASIQQYWNTFQGYPTVGTTIGTETLTPPPTPALTSSEALVLCLQGGLKITVSATTPPTVTAYTYSASDIGRGTVSLNPRNPKRYAPFGGVTRSDPGNCDAQPHMTGFTDSGIPEFMDAFPEPMPILYAAANTSATKKFTWGSFGAYGNPDPKADGNQFNESTQAPAQDYADLQYFADPASKTGTTPSTTTWARYRNADSYILIGAGPDRKYGTKDDQTNFGTPGE